MPDRVSNTNPAIFRQCRQQMALSQERVIKKTKVKRLKEIETGDIAPTFKQLEKLANLYCVPQWVFLRDQLPAEYNFNQSIPAFRKFAQHERIFDNHAIRALVTHTEQLREMIMEFKEDEGEPLPPFSPPAENNNIPNLALSVRRWLGCGQKSYEFKKWRKFVEDAGVFVFLTSKYPHWSKVDSSLFRGFAIYKPVLPIIVINNSDAYKAQPFTLFHELAHLLRRESSADGSLSAEPDKQEELWCNRLASEVLMPEFSFAEYMGKVRIVRDINADMDQIKQAANRFCVSSFACIVRMCQLGIISKSYYARLERHLYDEYKSLREKQRNEDEHKFFRNIAREKIQQYGDIYAKTVVQAYKDNEIGLHKLCKLFELKSASDAINLEKLL